MFESPLHVGRPNIGDRDAFSARVADMFDRRWLTNDGPYLQEFEARMAELLGVRHFIAVVNGTAALEIMGAACGLTGEVIMPSFTFVATAHALAWIGAEPVFADVDPRTHNIDPASVESLITDKTTGIMGVHVWGRPCDVSALEVIADKHGVPLVFDAAHALGCTHGGRMIGNFGSAESFSFHATKFFNTFEGGAITTNDEEVARRCRRLRNFGQEGHDNIVSFGINGKMAEVCAAMGLTNLDALPGFIETNARNYRWYAEGLQAVPGVDLIEYSEAERSNFQYVVVEVDAARAGVTRDDLHDRLQGNNVLARRYFYPGCHMMKPYASRPQAVALPHTERLTQRTLSLPTGTAVDETAIKSVCRIIAEAVHGVTG